MHALEFLSFTFFQTSLQPFAPYPYLPISACLSAIAAVLQILHRPSSTNTEMPLLFFLFEGFIPQSARLRKIDFHCLGEICSNGAKTFSDDNFLATPSPHLLKVYIDMFIILMVEKYRFSHWLHFPAFLPVGAR